MLLCLKNSSNHSKTFSAANHLLIVTNAKLVSMYLQLPTQVEKCLMKSQKWFKETVFAKVDYWIWIAITKLRIVKIFWKLSYRLYWKQLQKWLRYLDITFVTKLLTIFVDYNLTTQKKLLTPTVPNESYRFWADLPLEGHP